MKSRAAGAGDRIAEEATAGLRKIQDRVVNGYKGVEGGSTKLEDCLICRYLARDGESIAEAKERLRREVLEIQAKSKL